MDQEHKPKVVKIVRSYLKSKVYKIDVSDVFCDETHCGDVYSDNFTDFDLCIEKELDQD